MRRWQSCSPRPRGPCGGSRYVSPCSSNSCHPCYQLLSRRCRSCSPTRRNRPFYVRKSALPGSPCGPFEPCEPGEPCEPSFRSGRDPSYYRQCYPVSPSVLSSSCSRSPYPKAPACSCRECLPRSSSQHRHLLNQNNKGGGYRHPRARDYLSPKIAETCFRNIPDPCDKLWSHGVYNRYNPLPCHLSPVKPASCDNCRKTYNKNMGRSSRRSPPLYSDISRCEPYYPPCRSPSRCSSRNNECRSSYSNYQVAERSAQSRHLRHDTFTKVCYPRAVPCKFANRSRSLTCSSCKKDPCSCSTNINDGANGPRLVSPVDSSGVIADEGPSLDFLKKSGKLGKNLDRFAPHYCPWEAYLTISGNVRGHCNSTAVEVARRMAGRFKSSGERYTVDSYPKKDQSAIGPHRMSLGILDDGTALNLTRNSPAVINKHTSPKDGDQYNTGVKDSGFGDELRCRSSHNRPCHQCKSSPDRPCHQCKSNPGEIGKGSSLSRDFNLSCSSRVRRDLFSGNGPTLNDSSSKVLVDGRTARPAAVSSADCDWYNVKVNSSVLPRSSSYRNQICDSNDVDGSYRRATKWKEGAHSCQRQDSKSTHMISQSPYKSSLTKQAFAKREDVSSMQSPVECIRLCVSPGSRALKHLRSSDELGEKLPEFYSASLVRGNVVSRPGGRTLHGENDRFALISLKEDSKPRNCISCSRSNQNLERTIGDTKLGTAEPASDRCLSPGCAQFDALGGNYPKPCLSNKMIDSKNHRSRKKRVTYNGD